MQRAERSRQLDGCFDVGSDGAVVYSNGFAASQLADGDRKQVARANLIESLCVA